MSDAFTENWANDLTGKNAPARQQQWRRPKYEYPSPACDDRRFLRHVANHQMEIVRDEDLYRHLKFAEPGAWHRWFEILTWPGRLCITGDMGTFVFTRLPDMFVFFRSTPQPDRPDALRVNPSYWAEKSIAADRDGIKQWSTDKFKAKLSRWFEDQEISESLWHAIAQNVLARADDGEHEAMSAAINFEYDDRPVFQDFWEVDCKEYTFTYLWCLYAIVWGIRQYDAAKINTKEASNVGQS